MSKNTNQIEIMINTATQLVSKTVLKEKDSTKLNNSILKIIELFDKHDFLKKDPEYTAETIINWTGESEDQFRPAAGAVLIYAMLKDVKKRSQTKEIVNEMVKLSHRINNNKHLRCIELGKEITGTENKLLLTIPEVPGPTVIGSEMLRGLNEYFSQNKFTVDNHNLKAIDIGSGSGILSMVMVDHLKKLGTLEQIIALDINPLGFMAEINSDLNDSNPYISFINSNCYEAIQNIGLEGNIDFIVSNPPLTPADSNEVVTKKELFNKAPAMDGGIGDGLDLSRRIVLEGSKFLRPMSGELLIHSSGRFASRTISLPSTRGLIMKKVIQRRRVRLGDYVDIASYENYENQTKGGFKYRFFKQSTSDRFSTISAKDAKSLLKNAVEVFHESAVLLYGFQNTEKNKTE